MNKVITVCIFCYLLSLFPGLYGAKGILERRGGDISGSYQYGNEIFFINDKNKSFYLKRIQPKSIQDVVVPLCYDTIAKGKFKTVSHDVIALYNSTDFNSIDFDIQKDNYLSKDTVYFKIVLPRDDAFSPGRFNYVLLFGCAKSVETKTDLIKIPKSEFDKCGHILELIIKDSNPINCIANEKCYQRTSFSIFDDLIVDSPANFFTINLRNFNECYVERIDVNNDLVYFDSNSIYWRGRKFKKIDAFGKKTTTE